MRIHGTHRESRAIHSPPFPQRRLHHASGADHAIGGEQRGDISEGNVGGHQHDAKRGSAIEAPLGRQHHGDIDVSGQVGQPLGVSGIGKSREVQRMLVGGSGDNAIHLTAERELGRGLHRVAGDTARPHGPAPVRAIAASQTPGSHAKAAVGRNRANLIVGPDQRNFCRKGPSQGAGGDLGTDPARITQRHRDPREFSRPQVLIST